MFSAEEINKKINEVKINVTIIIFLKIICTCASQLVKRKVAINSKKCEKNYHKDEFPYSTPMFNI